MWLSQFRLAGVCLGMQLAVCEFARNVLGWDGKNTQLRFYEMYFQSNFAHAFKVFLC